jgi:hypothetical protein
MCFIETWCLFKTREIVGRLMDATLGKVSTFNSMALPHTFPLTLKEYSLHFESLAGQENGPIHTLIKRTFPVIPTASDLADSLNTNASIVIDV